MSEKVNFKLVKKFVILKRCVCNLKTIITLYYLNVNVFLKIV